MADTLSEKLKYYMRRNGNLNEIELARAANLPQPTVHHILSGATTRPRRKSLIALAQALLIDVEELFGVTPITEISDQLKPHGFHLVPLLDWKQACMWPNAGQNMGLQIASFPNVLVDIPISNQAFALKIKTSIAETLFPEGAILVIDPSREMRDKSFVVVHVENEPEALFRQVLLDGSRCYLKSLNPVLSQIEPIRLQPADRIIGVAVQTRMNLD